ncbi:MAG: M1 family metallopeptidase [Flavobacteriales bacterium]|nr:M1 family metallopeptidase [Flavobacteriales bacterium]
MTRNRYLSILLLLFFCVPHVLRAQEETFTHQDTLRGMITAERAWWDLQYYHLKVKVDPADSTIEGSNIIRYKAVLPGNVLQVDLQPPMQIRKVLAGKQELQVTHDGNAHYVHLGATMKAGQTGEIEVFYGGKPRVAVKPPWDGGISWSKDAKGKPFVASSCQGLGASAWWPCKDHMYDEVDSMLISVEVPKGLTDVSNGRLRKVEEGKQTTTFHWFVANPINNYGVNINIAEYVHFGHTFNGEKGKLDVNFWVLKQNEAAARKQFLQVDSMLTAFEYWFGPYPFYEDGYKLVEVPYLGMEHQSSVTYGNGYKNGYMGTDLSGTGWGLKFDYIIVHESGHEWFANNITYQDAADMWIHEGFTDYSECLYLDYYFGKKAAREYVLGLRRLIDNDRPIIGTYNVNKEGSSDMYFKGANLLHMIRTMMQNDSTWRETLRGMNREFYHKTVITEQIEKYLSDHLGHNLHNVFDQYLRDDRIPILQYAIHGKCLVFKWSNCVDHFDMPVQVYVNGKTAWIEPHTQWSSLEWVEEIRTVELSADFYVAGFNLIGNPE